MCKREQGWVEHGEGAPAQPPPPSHTTPSGQSREAGAAGTSARVSDGVSFRAADPEAGGDGRGEGRFLPRRAASVCAVGRPRGGVCLVYRDARHCENKGCLQRRTPRRPGLRIYHSLVCSPSPSRVLEQKLEREGLSGSRVRSARYCAAKAVAGLKAGQR